MVSALILTITLTSGISLALRNKPKQEIKDEEFIGYLVLILILSVCAGAINCLLLSLYSYLKSDIPAPIFVVCFVYTVLACGNLGFQDALLATENVKIAIIFDLITILIQILTLIFFVNIAQTSLIVSVFIAFIFSYSLVSFASVAIILNNVTVDKFLLKCGMRSILTQSKKQHLFGIANGLVDRIDRFLVGLILPISFLAKYALLTSIISFARFLPDSVVKISLLNHHKGRLVKAINYSAQQLTFISLAGIALVIASQSFIYLAFGPAWILPIYVGVLLVGQEILRGNYQLKAVKLLAVGGTQEISRISGLLILLSIFLISIGIATFGVWGAPLAMVLVYSILTLVIESELKKYQNVN